MKRGRVISRTQKMRDGNVSLRWNKWNYQLILEIILLFIIFFCTNQREDLLLFLYVVSTTFIIVKKVISISFM